MKYKIEVNKQNLSIEIEGERLGLSIGKKHFDDGAKTGAAIALQTNMNRAKQAGDQRNYEFATHTFLKLYGVFYSGYPH